MRRRRITTWSHLVLLNAIAANQLPCQYALAYPNQHSKIISRKSDGHKKIYSLETSDDVDVGGGETSTEYKYNNYLDPSTTLKRLQSSLRSTFLPAVSSGANNKGCGDQLCVLRSSGYLKYMLYDNLQDLSTSLRSVLATQRILEGVGVGRASATALSATLNFLYRDGCGMLASLLFIRYASHSFRRNVKRWRYFADVMVDVGITLEIIAPSVLEKWFLPLLCAGNVCKALCGVSAGACSGALQMYWAVSVMGTEEGISEVA